MKLTAWNMARLGLACGVLTSALITTVSADEAPAGVTRISKPRQTPPPVQQIGFNDWVDSAGDNLDTINERLYGAPQPTQPSAPREPFRFTGMQSQNATPDVVEGEWIVQGPDGECDCPECHAKHAKKWRAKHCYGNGCKVQHGGWPCNQCGYNSSYDFCNYFHSKFGFLCPSGAGGAGAPFIGKYARVYPQDPNYFDGRDGQLYAAQGYGAPIAVPLAPVVGHAYNYGWGVPSSRLTPISRVAPR